MGRRRVSAIFTAIARQDLDAVKAAVEANPDSVKELNNGRTVMFSIISCFSPTFDDAEDSARLENLKAIANFLIESGTPINEANAGTLYTPLNQAAFSGSVEAAKILLDSRGDIPLIDMLDAVDSRGESPRTIAIRKAELYQREIPSDWPNDPKYFVGDNFHAMIDLFGEAEVGSKALDQFFNALDITKSLAELNNAIQDGAPINTLMPRGEQTPAEVSIERQELETISRLLQRLISEGDYDVNLVNGRDGHNALNVAIETGRAELVELLLARNSDILPRAYLPLSRTIQYNDNQYPGILQSEVVLEDVVRADNAVTSIDLRGKTLLDVAQEESDQKCATASAEICDLSKEKLQILEVFNNSCGDSCDTENDIFAAIRAVDTARVSELVADDLSILNSKNPNGETVMYYAVKQYSPFLDSGYDDARKAEVEDLVASLADMGAPLNEPNDETNITPLNHIAWFGLVSMANILLSHPSANTTEMLASVDFMGRTPVDIITSRVESNSNEVPDGELEAGVREFTYLGQNYHNVADVFGLDFTGIRLTYKLYEGLKAGNGTKISEAITSGVDVNQLQKGVFLPACKAIESGVRYNTTAYFDAIADTPGFEIGTIEPVIGDRAALHCAIREESPVFVEAALDRFADVEQRAFFSAPPFTNLTPLLIASDKIDSSMIEIMQVLLDNRADVTAVTSNGQGPIDLVSIRGNIYCNIDEHQYSPTHPALCDLFVEKANLLLDNGAACFTTGCNEFLDAYIFE